MSKSWALHSESRLGSLCGSDGCLLSCLIHPSPRKFLCVLYQDEVFQIRVLPFGPLVSPRFFIGMVDAMMDHVRSLGLQIHHYLDIWRIRILQVKYFRSQTQHHSILPSQDFFFIDTHYRRDLGLMFPPEVGSEKQSVTHVVLSEQGVWQLKFFSNCWGDWFISQTWFP